MIDIKSYSNNELSLLVFNTESLYKLINNKKELLNVIDNKYKYNKYQLIQLLVDINDYKLEYTNCSSEDLYMATKEMNENIDGKNFWSNDQIKCKKEIENNNKIFKVDLKPFANIPKSYLSKLKELNKR